MAVLEGPDEAPTRAPTGAVAGAPQRASVLVRLLLFLETGTNDDGDLALSEDAPELDAAADTAAFNARVNKALAAARAAGETDLALEAEKALAARRAKAGKSGGAAPENVARADDAVPLYAVPVNYELTLNTFREADKFTMTLPARDLPLLPELVRSALVEVFLATVPAKDFGRAESWAPAPERRLLQFRGYADSIDLDADELQVQVQACSLEYVLMNKEINPLTKSRRVKGSAEKVTDFLKRFFSTIPEVSGGALGGDPLGVRIYPNVDEDKIPLLSKQMLVRTLQSAESRAQAAGSPIMGDAPMPGSDPGAMPGQGSPSVAAPVAGTKIKAWDVVVRAAELCGLIPTYDPSVDPDNILLMLPQTLYESPREGIKIQGGARDGFSRTFSNGTSRVESEVRLFVWGRNLSKMRMERRYGRNKPKAVQVVSYNPDGVGMAKLVTARFPKTARGVAASPVGTTLPGAMGKGRRPVDEIVTVTVPGLRDKAAAEQLAVGLYHALSKRELKVSIETHDLQSYVDPAFPVDPNTQEGADLYRLRPGTPVRVLVARQQVDPSKGLVVNTLSELFERRSNPAFLRKMLSEQRLRANVFRNQRDYEQLEASLKKIENAYASVKLTDWFFVKTVVHKGSGDDGGGYSCRIELFNYVESRNAPENLSNGDKATNDERKATKDESRADRTTAAAEQATLDELVRLALEKNP